MNPRELTRARGNRGGGPARPLALLALAVVVAASVLGPVAKTSNGSPHVGTYGSVGSIGDAGRPSLLTDVPPAYNVTPGCGPGVSYSCLETNAGPLAGGTPLTSYEAQRDLYPIWATNPDAGTALLEVGFNPGHALHAPPVNPVLQVYHAGSWTNMTVGSNSGVLPNGYIVCAAWDPQRGAFVAIDSIRPSNGTVTLLTYQFNGTAWSNVTASVGHPNIPSPGDLPACALAWFPDLSELVLVFGGVSMISNELVGPNVQTWTLNSSGAWSNRTASVGIPNDWSPSLAYDPQFHVLVLFGEVGEWNLDGTYILNTTGGWTNLSYGTFYKPLGFSSSCGLVLETFGQTVALYYGGHPCVFVSSSQDWFWEWGLGRGIQTWINQTSNGTLPAQVLSPELGGPIGPLTDVLVSGDLAGNTGSGVLNYTSLWQAPPPFNPGPRGTTVNGTGDCNSVTVSWTPPPPPPGENITQTWIWVYNQATGALVQIVQLTGYPTSSLVLQLACGVTYEFKIELWFSSGPPSFGQGVLFTTGSIYGTASCVTTTPLWAILLPLGLFLLLLLVLIAWGIREETRKNGGRRRGR